MAFYMMNYLDDTYVNLELYKVYKGLNEKEMLLGVLEREIELKYILDDLAVKVSATEKKEIKRLFPLQEHTITLTHIDWNNEEALSKHMVNKDFLLSFFEFPFIRITSLRLPRKYKMKEEFPTIQFFGGVYIAVKAVIKGKQSRIVLGG